MEDAVSSLYIGDYLYGSMI